MTVNDVVRDARAQIAYEAEVAQERRRFEEAEQRSAMKTAEERIRLWERRHQLVLPKRPEHPLNNVIAAQTLLTMAEVLGEAQRRSAALGTKAPSGDIGRVL